MAFERLSGSSGGALDFDRARGGTIIPSQGPALQYSIAADVCNDAKLKLYPVDFAVVHRVCVLGFTLEQAARQLYEGRADVPWPAYLRRAGMRFREGLDQLADMWWPDARTMVDKKTGQEIRPMRATVVERAEVTDAPPPDRVASAVAHATRDKVYRGPQRRERA